MKIQNNHGIHFKNKKTVWIRVCGEIGVWNRILTREEINALYRSERRIGSSERSIAEPTDDYDVMINKIKLYDF